MQVQIFENNGIKVVSSRVIAQELCKRHDIVLRDIREKIDSHEFVESYYINSQNKKQPEYLLSKDSFILLIMNYEGFNEFKRAYINAFNSMEKQLNLQAPTNMIEALTLALEQAKQIEVMQPKADFYDTVIDSKKAISMRDVASVIGCGLGRNKLFELLRNSNILDKNNLPYQEYINRGYFNCVESKFTKPNGNTEIKIKTLVNQKGVEYIIKLIKNIVA